MQYIMLTHASCNIYCVLKTHPNVVWLATKKKAWEIYSDKQIVFRDCELALPKLFIDC